MNWNNKSNKWMEMYKIWGLICLNMNKLEKYNNSKLFIWKVIWEYFVELNLWWQLLIIKISMISKEVVYMINKQWISLNYSMQQMIRNKIKRLNIRHWNLLYHFKLHMFIILIMYFYLIQHKENCLKKLNLLFKQL